MGSEERPLSQLVPVLVAILVCDVAVRDPATGKHSLIGIFDRIWAQKFPTRRTLFLYIKLADAQGRYNLEARFLRSQTGEELVRAKGEAEISDRLIAADFSIQLPPVEFPAEGRYEFQVWANEVFLGRSFIDAVLQPR